MLGVAILVGCCLFITEKAACIGNLAGCLYGCSTLAFYITGLVYRCRQSGNYASGDIKAIADISEDEWISLIEDDDTLY